MKTSRTWTLLGASLLSLAGALLLPGCVREVQPTPANSENATAFIGVNVVPMDAERVLEDHTVIVRNGLITSLGPSATITVPADAERIDGKGRYLMPGLADFHVHLHSEEQLLSYLAHGVTSLFELDGSREHLELGVQLKGNSALGPTLYTSSPLLDGGPPGGKVVSVRTPEQARVAVVKQKNAGYEALKVYDNITPEVYATLVAMARQQRIPVVGHVPRTVGVEAVLRSRQALISHGEEYFHSGARDEAGIAGLARATKEAGTSVVPDLVHIDTALRMLTDLEGVFADPEARYLSPEVIRNWRFSNPTRRVDVAAYAERERAAYPFVQHLTLALQKEGVRLLLGSNASDAGLFPGKSTQLELAELVKAGLSPYEALSAGTRNAGSFITEHVDSAARFGTVAVGQRADLLLLPGNPLEDVSQANRALGVMVRGQWLPREWLQKKREKTAEAFSKR
ncbi:amidohydrolase family protein [Archangium lansingense]|uniref:Amidohydrolase family protein n=1 Tax=Archangium lansingense TaxID=2995310 RepID=A0ABT3ZXU8_9BACT|nr:amidohydrolase family protein [Archangium lansinium]MCY1074221.1 amidohydrolase family protein [Archangium lansinium]